MDEKALGRVGLANLGNTCFLNVIVQCLRYCPGLMTYITTDTYKLHLKNNRKLAPIFEEFVDVVKAMWGSDVRVRATMAPRGFINVAMRLCEDAGYANLVSGGQSDAAEFLQFMLESIHSSVCRQVQMDIVGTPKTTHDNTQVKALQSWVEFHRKEYSIVIDNFFGQTQTNTTCGSCGAVSSRFEPWMMLKAPIPTNSNEPIELKKCIDISFAKETLEDYKCDRCGKQGHATLQGSISRLPPTLILVLKRFTNTNMKIRRRVNVNVKETNMSQWISFPHVLKNISPLYSTFAVVEHHGGSRGGHYVSYTKHNDTWLNYDDTSNRVVKEESDLVNDDSYIFFMSRTPYLTPIPIVKDTNRE